ncbi:MAG: hypothetical protein ACQESG_04015 [Nanobdellota archaeon]
MKGVNGLLAFFIFTLFAVVVLTIKGGITDLWLLLSDPTIPLGVLYWIIPLDILMFSGVVGYLCYAIHLLLRRRGNAVAVAKLALGLIFFMNLIPVFIEFMLGIPFDQSLLYTHAKVILQSFVYSSVCFFYLIYSKQVKATYPQGHARTVDEVVFVGLLAIPVTIYVLSFAGVGYEPVIRDLGPDEYSDGIVYFEKPDGMSLTETDYEGTTTHIMDGQERVVVTGTYYFGDRSEFFERFYRQASLSFNEGETMGTMARDVSGRTAKGFFYMGRSIQVYEPHPYLWSVYLVFDDTSDKAASVAELKPVGMNSSNLNQVMDSVCFS